MDETEITVCPSDQINPALQVLFGRLSATEREAMVASIGQNLREEPTGCGGLLVAVHKGMILGAVLVQPQPGKTAVVWPPNCSSANESLTLQLGAAANQYLEKRNVRLAQALLGDSEDPAIHVLERMGFSRLTDLAYLIAPIRRTGSATRLGCGLEFEPYDESKRSRLITVIEATYADTQDCPQLNGVRRMDDVLAGYRSTGVFDPAKWFIFSKAGSDVGVLLLSEYPQSRQWEVVYMGLIPHARRRGYGKVLIDVALSKAALAGMDSIVLAVDTNNRDGLRLYQRSGFREWNRRIVYWRVLCANPAVD